MVNDFENFCFIRSRDRLRVFVVIDEDQPGAWKLDQV